MNESFQLIKLQLSSSSDMKTDLIRIQDIELEIIYLDSVCDEKKIKADLIFPILECSGKEEFKDYLSSLPDISKPEQEQDILQKLMIGHTCIQLENELFLFNAKKVINNQLGDASSETAIYGSQRSFSDVMDTNLNLIRYRYPSPNLVYEKSKVNGVPQTEIGIIYDSLLVDKGVLSELQTQLASVKPDVILSAAHLQRLLTTRKYSLFPILMITERPDRVALNLKQGKIVILVEGSPFVLIAPATFFDFISSMDDTFEQLWVSFSLVVLRYISIFITVLLPGIYISLVSFNPELFQSQLAFSIAGSRSGIPYPSYIEVLIMMFLIDTLIEASIRLPKSISAAATTVGGLILGQAAQQANLVSNIMIIVTSAIGIANFVVPINAMSFALRIVKYPFILLASLFGYVGLIAGLFCLILYLNDLKSFGKPYLKVFIGEQENFGKL